MARPPKPQHPHCHPGTRYSLAHPLPPSKEEIRARKERAKQVAPDALLNRLEAMERRLAALERGKP
jgi:hypothetical protein